MVKITIRATLYNKLLMYIPAAKGAASMGRRYAAPHSKTLYVIQVMEVNLKPKFRPGKNIAIKVPAHEFEKMVNFYDVVLGFTQKETNSPDDFKSVTFEFGDKNLWIDKIAGLSQAEVWLEIETDNATEAKEYLKQKGCAIRDEIEPLPPSFNGFWLSSPSNTIHLVNE